MVARNYSNTAPLLALTANISNTAVSIPVGSTANYPTVPFTLVLERRGANQEVVLCTAVAPNAFTVTRGYDGTTAVAHATGASVEHTVAALDYAEANAHANVAHFATGTVDAKGDLLVGTADNTVDRLAVGADGYNLVPEASAATGLRYEKSRGTIVCTSTTRPTLGLYDGIRIFETDTNLLYLRVGGVWMPEPGQVLGHSRVTANTGFAAPYTVRFTLNFTMPTLALGRRVKLIGKCYFLNLAAAYSGHVYAYGLITRGSVTLETTITSCYIAGVSAISVPIGMVSVDNTDIPAGATTVSYGTQVITTGSAYLSHQLAAGTDAPAYLEAMII